MNFPTTNKSLILIILGIFLVNCISATWVNSGGILTVGKGEVVEEDLIFAGEILNVDGTVKGDVIFAGKKVDISGVIEGSLIAAGSELTITGKVENDVIFAGGNVNILGRVSDNVIFAGNHIQTKEESMVKGDIITFSQSQELKGSLGGKKIKAKISPKLEGGLGELRKMEGSIFSVISFLFKFVTFLFVLITGILMFLIIPKQTEKSSSLIGEKPLKSLLVGILLLIGVPFLILLLMILLITFPLALILGAIYLFALLIISKILVAHLLGKNLLQSLNSKVSGFWHNLLALITGLVILEILLLVPFLGWITKLLVVLFGLGAIGLAICDVRKTGEKGAKKKEAPKNPAKKKSAPKKKGKVTSKRKTKKK